MDFLSDLFGGSSSGGGSGFGNFLGALASAGIGAFGNYQTSKLGNEQALQTQAFTAGEAEKERAFQEKLLMLKLAQGSGGGGGGSGNAAAMANVKRQGLADAAQSKIQGSQLNQNALELFLKGIQNPYMRG